MIISFIFPIYIFKNNTKREYSLLSHKKVLRIGIKKQSEKKVEHSLLFRKKIFKKLMLCIFYKNCIFFIIHTPIHVYKLVDNIGCNF